MVDTGYIDWDKIAASRWTDTREGGTCVYAYWLSEHRKMHWDSGLDMLREIDAPDPFVKVQWAAHMIGAFSSPTGYVSPNKSRVYDHEDNTRPILAAMCLGSSGSTFKDPSRDRYWWAAGTDLSFRGRRILRTVSRMYARPPVILTYLDLDPIRSTVPETDSGPATVA